MQGERDVSPLRQEEAGDAENAGETGAYATSNHEIEMREVPGEPFLSFTGKAAVFRPESAGSGCEGFAELFAEVIAVVETAARGDLADGAVAVDQQVGCVLKADLHEVIHRTASDCFPEMTVEAAL